MTRLASVMLVFLVALSANLVLANEWLGIENTRWDDPLNWDQGVVPLGASQHPEFGWDDPACPCYPLTGNTDDDGPLGNNNAQLRYQGFPTEILIDENTMHPVIEQSPGVPANLATAYGVRVGNGGVFVTVIGLGIGEHIANTEK